MSQPTVTTCSQPATIRSSPAPHILLAVLIFLLPGNGAFLDWERSGSGLYTLWTAHFVHWSVGHLFFDCLIYAVFGTMARQLYGLRIIPTFLITAPLLTLGTAFLAPEVGIYRGLSGFDTLLFTFVAIGIFRTGLRDGDQPSMALSVALLLGLTFKTAYEAFTGAALFAQDLGEGIVTVPEVHLLGAAFGALLAALPVLRASPEVRVAR